MKDYDFKAIESKWQKRWRDEHLFAADDSLSKQKMYVLDMFLYPSGDGLHVGHVKIYSASDVVARYMRMKGFNVLHPMGWDAFGLPTENTAIKRKAHPAELTRQNIERFRAQMQHMGFSYDWSREINTTDPSYYKWTQWIFLQLYKAGLAYEATIPINWCPSCKTGLANEEVIDGRCERCGTLVELRPMRQWLLRITRYADRLLAGLEGLAWPKFVLELQQNWIGRSEGSIVHFEVKSQKSRVKGTSQSSKDIHIVDVFTTRPDTLFGATYLVLAPEYPLVKELLSQQAIQNVDVVAAYIETAGHKTDLMRQEEEKDKTGVELKGITAINPATGEEIPVWVADYVLMSYGTGAIMAVPAHDERDWDFAKKYGLSVKCVIDPYQMMAGQFGDSLHDAEQKTKEYIDAVRRGEAVYIHEGTLMNSGDFDGVYSRDAREKITAWLEKKRLAERKVMYKLRDWVFSRQRYWGEPIPLIHCERCGIVPIPEEDLPVELPTVEKYEPTGTGESPLAAVDEWVNVVCPQCGDAGRRETNTMPQWAGSSWYWLRYCDPCNADVLAAPESLKRWLPVDIYIGGAEHAVLHLLYARFWSHVLADRGIVPEAEPFQRFHSVGLVLGEDGQKMSKSRGNVVNPDQVVEEYGADTLRVYEMFMGPFEASIPWNMQAIAGAYRFLQRIWSLVQNKGLNAQYSQVADDGVRVVMHRTIKRVTDGIEQFRFNTAIAALMELLNELERQETVSRDSLRDYVLLLAPFAPHVAEELWEMLGNESSLIRYPWPQHDPGVLARAAISISVQVNGKVRGELEVVPYSSQEEVAVAARKLPRVAKYLEEGSVERVVYVSGRMINFVIRNSPGMRRAPRECGA